MLAAPSLDRPIAPTAWHHPVTFGLAVLWLATLAWDASGADLPIMQWLGSGKGFALQHHWLLERVLHEAWRQLFLGLYLVLIVWALWPLRRHRAGLAAMDLPRRERVTLVLLVALCLVAVNLVKVNSLTSCPWELQAFGGQAHHVSHWALGQVDGGSGHCFPGGHVSSALAFLSLCLPWLAPPDQAARNPATGLRWLITLLVAGLIAGAVQTLRGAHYPSHTLWTLLICASVSWTGWLAARPWMARA